MDANVQIKTEDLANEIATHASTIEELNGVMRSLMKSALERMLGAELRVHLTEEAKASETEPRASAEGEGSAPPSRKGGNRRNGTSPEGL